MQETRFVEALPDELERWQRDGILGPAQTRRIASLYGLAAPPGGFAGSQGRMAAIVGVLGALLAGIGVILFVASNWEHIDRFVRLVILLTTLVGVSGGAVWLTAHEHPRIGAALHFLAALVFGANIFLVAQTYHVNAGEPGLLAFWAAGAFLLAYAARSRPAMVLSILVSVLWLILQLVDWRIDRLGIGLVIGVGAFIPFGLLFFGLGELQRGYRRTAAFAATFTVLGALVAFAAPLVFSYAWFWEDVVNGAREAAPAGGSATSLYVTVALFSAAALALAGWRAVRGGKAGLVQAGGSAVLLASLLLVIYHPLRRPEDYAFVFNVLLLAGVLWLIVLGLMTHREGLINVALTYFVLLTFSRYFDFFFSLLDRSLAFIGAGVLLLAGGFILERSRRALMGSMRVQEVGHV
jgi:uncharacterized membrane protein